MPIIRVSDDGIVGIIGILGKDVIGDAIRTSWQELLCLPGFWRDLCLNDSELTYRDLAKT